MCSKYTEWMMQVFLYYASIYHFGTCHGLLIEFFSVGRVQEKKIRALLNFGGDQDKSYYIFCIIFAKIMSYIL